MIKEKLETIEMREIVNFCENYNAVGYGTAKIIELQNKIIVELYNGGFSTNEEMDSEFLEKYSKHIIMNKHPSIIAEFSILPLMWGTRLIGFENLKNLCSCYEKKDTYKYLIEIR